MVAQVRFFRRGKSLIKFLPAVASLTAPTSAEITAGVDLSPLLQGIAGFQLSNAPIETPDLSTVFNSQINGPDSVSTSTITLYDGTEATTPTIAARTALAKGTAGFILLQPYGATTAKRAEVWPVTVTGINDAWDLGATAAQFVVGFAVTSTPAQNAVNP